MSMTNMISWRHYENAYSNILKISPPKTESSDKNADIFSSPELCSG